jgi:hypothetical protein
VTRLLLNLLAVARHAIRPTVGKRYDRPPGGDPLLWGRAMKVAFELVLAIFTLLLILTDGTLLRLLAKLRRAHTRRMWR